MGTSISGRGAMSYISFGTWGRGDEGDKILKCYTLTYLRSVSIFIKQYSDSMCFSSIFSFKLRNIPYLCEIDVRTLPRFGPHKNLFNSNLVSKLVSTAAEWIVLSFDTPYYTELPPYSPKTEIENWFNMFHRRCCSLYQLIQFYLFYNILFKYTHTNR